MLSFLNLRTLTIPFVGRLACECYSRTRWAVQRECWGEVSIDLGRLRIYFATWKRVKADEKAPTASSLPCE